MFGLTLEKLLLIAVIAAFVIGPQRLPLYTARLTEFVRGLKGYLEASRSRTEAELGVPLSTAEWEAELRRYDPRRIIRDAWREEDAAPASAAPDAETEIADSTPPAAEVPTAPAAPARTRWVVTGGSSGHPRRIRVTEETPVATASG